MKRNLLLTLFLILCVCLSAQAVQGGVGKFSVAKDKQVYFSHGNLQYVQSTNTWQFAELQYEFVGAANLTIGEDGNPVLADTIDLFGWGTGHNPTLWSYDSNDYNEYVDWGVNRIGGDEPNTWRTLSVAEWRYLLTSRANALKLRGSASINGLFGMILLPDDWASLEGINYRDKWNLPKEYTLDEWQQMESQGAVFLPSTGVRTQTEVEPPKQAIYWSSTGTAQIAFGILISTCTLEIGSNSHPYFGGAVRLVQDVNNVTTHTETTRHSVLYAEKIARDGKLYILYNGNLYTVLATKVQ